MVLQDFIWLRWRQGRRIFRTKSRCAYQRSPLQIVQETQHYPQQQTFFSERVINAWNYLPYDIVCFNSLSAFVVDFNLFLQCYYLVHWYIVITVFSRPSFMAIVSAPWCLLVLLHSCFYLSSYFISFYCWNGISKLNWTIGDCAIGHPV